MTQSNNWKTMKVLVILIIGSIGVQANASIVAILEIIPDSEDVEMSISEFRQLTDELRTQARKTLPREYSILTRDNILQLLPPDEESSECLAEGCAVVIGRAIGAEYITQGQVRVFGGNLTLGVELYESMSGNLISSFTARAENAVGLLNAIEKESATMFGKLSQLSEPRLSDSPDSIPQTTGSTPQTQALPSVALGITARAGFAKSGAENGKSGMAYSIGLIAVKNFRFLDFVPELRFSSDEFEINEKKVSVLKIDVPLTARIVFIERIGLSAGAVAAVPLSVKIEGEVPKDAEKFGVAATGGLTYIFTDNIFINAFYEKYFTENFKSVKNSNTDKVLCGIGYLF